MPSAPPTGAGGPALYRVPLPLVGGYSYLAARAIPSVLLLPYFRRHPRATPALPRETHGRSVLHCFSLGVLP